MVRGFNLMDQLSESKAVIGLNMLRLWDDRGTLEPWIAPLAAALGDGTVSPSSMRRCPLPMRPRRTGFWRHGRTSARLCWCLEVSENALMTTSTLHRIGFPVAALAFFIAIAGLAATIGRSRQLPADR